VRCDLGDGGARIDGMPGATRELKDSFVGEDMLKSIAAKDSQSYPMFTVQYS
jgi:hypothetical protein